MIFFLSRLATERIARCGGRMAEWGDTRQFTKTYCILLTWPVDSIHTQVATRIKCAIHSFCFILFICRYTVPQNDNGNRPVVLLVVRLFGVRTQPVRDVLQHHPILQIFVWYLHTHLQGYKFRIRYVGRFILFLFCSKMFFVWHLRHYTT